MHCNVWEVDREGEGAGRRGENSAEGPRLVHLEAEDRHSFPVPSLVLIQLESPPVPRGRPSSCGKGNVIRLSFQVFDFELTPEDMKAIDGINRNIRYYEFLL